MPVYDVTGDISKDKRAALGKLCIHWAILEQRIEQVIWALRGVNRKVGRKITSNMPSGRRRIQQMVKEANARFLSEHDKSQIDDIAKHLEDLALERNWAIHGLWGKGLAVGEKRKTFAISYFHRHGGKVREMSVTYLDDLTNRIATATHRLEHYIEHKIGVPVP